MTAQLTLAHAISKLEGIEATLRRVVFAREEGNTPTIGYLYADATLEHDDEIGTHWDGTVLGGEFVAEDFPFAEGLETLAATTTAQLQVLRAALAADLVPLAEAVDRSPHLDAALALAEAILAEPAP